MDFQDFVTKNFDSILITVISMVVSMIIGGIITWYFAWKYYKQAGDELLKETGELKLYLTHLSLKTDYLGSPYKTKLDEDGKYAGQYLNLGSMKDDVKIK